MVITNKNYIEYIKKGNKKKNQNFYYKKIINTKKIDNEKNEEPKIYKAHK